MSVGPKSECDTLVGSTSPPPGGLTPPPGGFDVGFVLSGGGAFGAVQAGQLLALFQAGVLPDVVSGVSAGALNASFLANNWSLSRVEDLIEFWEGLDLASTVFVSRPAHRLVRVARGLSHVEDPSGLSRMIKTNCLVDDLSSSTVPLVVTTTNLSTGQPHFWSKGPASDIALASASLPGVFPPVMLDGHLHVDGGVLDPVPVRALEATPPKVVFVLDVYANTPYTLPANMSALSVLNSSFALSRRHLSQIVAAAFSDRTQVFSLPAPDLSDVSFTDSSQASRLVASAFELTEQFLVSHGLDASGVKNLCQPPDMPPLDDLSLEGVWADDSTSLQPSSRPLRRRLSSLAPASVSDRFSRSRFASVFSRV